MCRKRKLLNYRYFSLDCPNILLYYLHTLKIHATVLLSEVNLGNGRNRDYCFLNVSQVGGNLKRRQQQSHIYAVSGTCLPVPNVTQALQLIGVEGSFLIPLLPGRRICGCLWSSEERRQQSNQDSRKTDPLRENLATILEMPTKSSVCQALWWAQILHPQEGWHPHCPGEGTNE